MKLAFYKAEHGNIIDKLIGLWTRGPFSHVELLFSDGVSFSSSQWDGGVRFKKIDYSHKERWSFLDIDGIANESEVKYLANKLRGAKYDWLGIFLYEFLPFNIQNSKKWYCSEICAHLLGLTPCQMSPNKLYKIVKEGI